MTASGRSASSAEISSLLCACRWASFTTMIRERPAARSSRARASASAGFTRATSASGSQGASPQGTSPTAMLGGVSSSTTNGSTRGGAVPVSETARRAAASPIPSLPAARSCGAASHSRSRATRSFASSRRESGSRPSATAFRIPASISRMSSGVGSGPRQSRSAPAARERIAPSTRPTLLLTACMSSASEITTPSKPSSSRSRVVSVARLSVAGRSPVSSGIATCAVMIDFAPASMAARNGTSSRSQSSSREARTTGISRWESWEVAPWPGKCFTQAATPSDCRPRTAATVCRATRSADEPNDRVPMTGLSSAVLMSATGPMSRFTPQAASSAAMAR